MMPPSLGSSTCNLSPPLWRQFLGAGSAALLAAKPPERNGMRILVARRLFRRFAGGLCRYRSGKAIEVAGFA